MRPHRFFDRDGRYHAPSARLSRVSVLDYYGEEIPNYEKLGLDAKKVYRLLKHPDELRRAVASSTFACLPIYSEHVEQHRPDLVIGSTGSNIAYKDGYLTGNISLWSKQAIAGVEDRTRPAVSLSYDYLPLMCPGVFAGLTYDGVQTRMRGKHVAVVPIGRAGFECDL
jgi:uncharacterized protein